MLNALASNFFILQTLDAFKLQAKTESRKITLSTEIEQSVEFWLYASAWLLFIAFCVFALFGVSLYF